MPEKEIKAILEVGCGSGNYTYLLRKVFNDSRIWAMDISDNMVRIARQKLPDNKTEFVTADAETAELEGSFDLITSNAALHWIIDHIPVIEGIARSLKPSGMVLLQMGGKGNAALIFSLANHKCGNGKWSVYFKDFKIPYGFYGPEEYVGWLQQAGLTANRVELIPKDMVHRSKDDLAAWVRTTWLPYTQRIPAAMQDNYIEEIVDEYLGICPPDQNGCTHVQMYRLEVEATQK